MTRTCVAQVVKLACAPHISCVISMRSCCVFDSLQLLHFPLFALYFLSFRPVFLPGHQLHLPRCEGQIPCELHLMRTLAPLLSANLVVLMNTIEKVLNILRISIVNWTSAHFSIICFCPLRLSLSETFPCDMRKAPMCVSMRFVVGGFCTNGW